jgi:enamine deaminase RidA (YjgF/YER057c/UK114 family)
MIIERFETGPRLSRAVVHGETIYLVGIVSEQPMGKSTAEQTREILPQIDALLTKAGSDKSMLLPANIWLTNMANFAEMNAIWEAWLPLGCPPARATVQAMLASADRAVEIMVVAARRPARAV